MKRLRDVLAALAFPVIVWILYRKALRLWWTYDDANTLRLSTEHTIAQIFFDSKVWPQKLFTPLLYAWIELQAWLWDLDTVRWYVLHLVALSLTAIAFYAVLRLWFGALASASATVLFLTATSIAALAPQLNGLHYFAAIFFGSLTTIAYVRALRSNRFALTFVAAALYLVAMLARETIVPLVVLLVFLPERDARTRIRFAVPSALTLCVYLAWRWSILGTLLGGYGWAVAGGDWLTLALTLPVKIVSGVTGTHVVAGIALLVVTAIGVIAALRTKRAWLIFLVAMALAVAPLVPVSKEMQRRYTLMPWLVWSIAFVAGASTLKKRHAVVLLTIAPLIAIVVNRQEWRHEYAKLRRMSDEARFFVDAPPDVLLRSPSVPPAAMGETNWLKTLRLGKPAGASYFYDDLFLCTNDVGARRIFQYDDAVHAMREMRIKANCTFRDDVPLSAEFHYKNEALFWTFGPYTDGRWRVVIANGVQAFDVPRVDGFRLPGVPGLTLRIRYDSPAGWTTYSPDINLDFVHHPDVTWHR